MTFEVISEDVHGDPVRCSYCTRGAPHVVALGLPIVAGTSTNDLWLGLCAYCVLDMARALQRAEGKQP